MHKVFHNHAFFISPSTTNLLHICLHLQISLSLLNKEMKASSSSLISASPSLNSYSSSNNTLAEVAARVAQELRLSDPLPFEWDGHHQPLQPYYEHEDDEEEDEFEFSFVSGNPESSSLVPADEIFHNGKIKPSYFFLAGDSLECGRVKNNEVVKKPTRRPQLRVLMGVDRAEAESSCSSSEADELDRIAPGTYCVWKPDACKKSNSAGSSASSSRRWKLKQLLLKRSNSDGAKAVVLLAAKTVADGDGTGGGEKAKCDGPEEVESYVRNHNTAVVENLS